MFLKMSLIYKFALSACIVVALGIGVYATVNIENLRNVLLNEEIRDADVLSETIVRTTHYQMLEDDRKRVFQMISEVGTQQGVEVIRLVSKDGTIIFSTDRGEIGRTMDKSAEGCFACHAEDQPLLHASSMNRSSVFFAGGKEVLGMTRAIYNEASCYTAPCHFHPKEARILGILNLHLSLDGMHAQIRSFRHKTLILTAIVLVILGTGLTTLTQEMVNRPLRKLLQHTQLVAEGNLDVPLQVDSTDEIGDLGDAFNSMTAKLKVAREDLEDWAKNLEAKVEERTKELNEIQSQLVRTEKLASLGELVAGIAHEINNPLTGILVFSSLVEKDVRLHPELRGDLQTIERETKRCAAIVKGLLEFSRKSIPEKSAVNLNGVMDEALALVEHQSLFQNVEIRRLYDPNLPEVCADRNQIEQVFVNMIVNAGHAMAGGGELRVVTGEAPDSRVKVEIHDTGCGIPAENISRIFDPFFSTKDTRGTGLGLSVSYGIIRNHGGDISVESRVGEGTVFSILLPCGQGGIV